jgi:hypothetical protein
MRFSFSGLFADNMINGLGRFLGEGKALRRLTKVRLMFHGAAIPLMFIPIIEASVCYGLIRGRIARVAMGASMFGSVCELLQWFTYDTAKLQVVDNQESSEHSIRYLAGTLSYTSGKVLKCVLPVAILCLFSLGVGSAVLWTRSAPAGNFLVASGLVSLLSGGVQRPDIQLYGEPISMALIWATIVSL